MMRPDAAEVTPHPDEAQPWALADRIVQAQVEALVLGAVEHPVRLGRYEVERSLGSGTMGRLVLAFDPDLQRRVALKLIAPAHARSPEARRRIVREARAMAQLSNANVAQVYEVDDLDGHLALAIEFVDGTDLRDWLAAGPHALDEVLRVFGQAGRGLAAAHAKGITHRDFKPDNVMLTGDGHAKVIDFGLAHPGARPVTGSARDGDSWAELTRTGATLGTPAYMAPEQWEEGKADASSDQFAFCVALYESLCQRRPFPGETAAEVRQALGNGAAPFSPGVPRWLRRAVSRGLERDPARRWPDMAALLSAIDPARRRRRIAVWGTAGVIALLGGLAARSPADPCADAGTAIREHYNDGVRAKITASASETDTQWGSKTGAGLLAGLDTHVGHWRAAATNNCVASVRADSPAAACLRRARHELLDTIELATSGDASSLVGVLASAELIADPRACVDAPKLAAYAADAPDEAPARAALHAAKRGLDSLSVRSDPAEYTTQLANARKRATAAVAAAEAIGNELLVADALFVAGRLDLRDGQPKRAERRLRRALTVASETGQSPLTAAVVTELIYAVARDRERFGEAEDLADQAAGLIAALGNPPLLRARLLSHRASALAHAAEADHDAAVDLHREALALVVAALGSEHPAAISARGNLGAALNYARRPADAQVELAAAVEAASLAWGTEHPRTALLMGTLGLAQMRQGEMNAALDNLRRSLDVREAALGSDHGQVDDARYNLASALRREDEHAEAIVLLEAGLKHTLQRLGPDDARLGPWWVATGESALALGDDRRAREALQASLRVFERTGASARDYARVRLSLAKAWSGTDPARARAVAEQARRDAVEAESSKRKSEIDALLATL